MPSQLKVVIKIVSLLLLIFYFLLFLLYGNHCLIFLENDSHSIVTPSTTFSIWIAFHQRFLLVERAGPRKMRIRIPIRSQAEGD